MDDKIPNEIGLGEFIAKVKEDLKPTEDSPIFFLEKVELEIHVTVSQGVSGQGKATGKANLNINVLGADLLNLGEVQAEGQTSGELQRQAVHTIKANLSPILTREEMRSGLSEEELEKIRANIKKKIMRGVKEEEKSSLSEGEPKNGAAPKKRMRG